MCAMNHTDPEIIKCGVVYGRRNLATVESDVTPLVAELDATFCAALHPERLNEAEAREAAARLGNAFEKYLESLDTESTEDPFVSFDFFRHVEAALFTRALAYWREIGMEAEQVFRLLEIAKSHRVAVLNADAPAGEALASIAAGVETVDGSHRVAESYRSILQTTVDTAIAGYAVLTADQRRRLQEVYVAEGGR